MTTQIKVLRENVVKALSNIKDDNVSIAGITIERRKLLEALKLQTQSDADILTVNYGLVSWHYDYDYHSPVYKWEYDENEKMSRQVTKPDWWEHKPYTLDPQPCIQFSCNHTTMRFMNHPKQPKYGQELKVIPLNFVDHHEYVKPELSGIPLDTLELIGAINFVQHGIAGDDTRFVLACVLFESGDDTLKLVTADGFRLSIAKLLAKGLPKDKVLIYRSDIPKLLTFLKSNVDGKGKYKTWLDTYIISTEKTIKFMSEKGMVEFDKRDGTFPDYAQLIPKDGTKIEFIASTMLEAVKALSVTAKEGSGIIRLRFTHGEPCGNINLSSHCESYDGDNISSVDCDALVESDCKIAVNANYLMDVLKQCGDSKISMRVKLPSDPMIFDISDLRQEIAMPMFTQWEEDKTPKPEVPDEIDIEDSNEPTPEELNETISEA